MCASNDRWWRTCSKGHFPTRHLTPVIRWSNANLQLAGARNRKRCLGRFGAGETNFRDVNFEVVVTVKQMSSSPGYAGE
jgi:hypothetical protein